MAYDPQVVEATKVSDNPKNGLFEVVVVLKDRTHGRIFFERNLESGEIKASRISRLLKEPCPICRKDFLCNCLDRYLDNISGQALQKIES
ncbi:hypothetical protein ACFVVQ_00765 [Paenibacillus chitinolyticus]|uniref:Uncharacterized protein n=1 Tax=Paenibacillus chitinolyticus TaxID=79263 RepID=A0A410WUS9_9BACL|nr:MULTISPECIES: hypothetical protein [Paenibacillus]MCY9589457.1 hypothetical protein [Paenibacillus chitinolyticus]MCY9594530.1 hypothetical protein [Paenibacillus chitinolyticus]QAV18226.1 hypothetical protein PC41400_11340 [Paenibacillus chitinolyticus]